MLCSNLYSRIIFVALAADGDKLGGVPDGWASRDPQKYEFVHLKPDKKKLSAAQENDKRDRQDVMKVSCSVQHNTALWCDA